MCFKIRRYYIDVKWNFNMWGVNINLFTNLITFLVLLDIKCPKTSASLTKTFINLLLQTETSLFSKPDPIDDKWI